MYCFSGVDHPTGGKILTHLSSQLSSRVFGCAHGEPDAATRRTSCFTSIFHKGREKTVQNSAGFTRDYKWRELHISLLPSKERSCVFKDFVHPHS